MLNTQDLERKCEAIVNTQCENSFNQWSEQVLRASSYCQLPDGLQETLQLWLLEKKHLFFRDFKNKVIQTIDQQINQAINNQRNTSILMRPLTQPKTLQDIHNRTFLEAYLSHNMNQRQAAESIGVPKSTFNDWVQKHQELINSEVNKNENRNN